MSVHVVTLLNITNSIRGESRLDVSHLHLCLIRGIAPRLLYYLQLSYMYTIPHKYMPVTLC